MIRNRVVLALAGVLLGCGGGAQDDGAPGGSPGGGAASAESDDHGHDHAEHPIGTALLGEHELELAQGHGAVTAGKEAHLVVQLPYSDGGSTTVRAWLGTADRTLSYVGRGEYAKSHDDYDVHATAPDPLPADCRWWIELELPDGTRLVGSAQPLLE
ncbi:MAG: hypothetical protein AAF682_24970 [Planctomycetota bacterium]